MHFFLRISLGLIKMKNLTLIVTTALFIFMSTAIMYGLEPETFESFANTFYFVMTTFTTVGYGDYSPVTIPGKMFAVFMFLFGIGLLGVVIGKIVDSFTIFRKMREEGRLSYMKEKHIIVIGWGKKSESAVKEILDSDPHIEVVIIDTLPKAPIDVSDNRVHYVQGDPTNEEPYQKANITSASAVIIFADDTIQDPALKDAKTLLVSITIERLAPDVHTTVEVMTEKQIANFAHSKVDEFILSQETISRLAVRSALYKGVSQVYSQLISRQHGEDLYKIAKHPSWNTYNDAFQSLLKQGATLIADRNLLDINRRLDETIPAEAELYIICNRETFDQIKSN
ncbi:potassium channel family protein [Halalkalibacter akibai]|uniref:Potassium channel protein n=1 Tax=Halalkalibacter akibai (strain ATCC 43226 / DSM 21942 / CIP 109018 / JCM 9157 / 1139) TaxID=1236973 RepID=W4QQR1_HALA3|nr:potassium channel protein [Halalkalibacter akibai]GAE33694.1 potassium channel protein [Halalkalibacter akibai JCM 9157]